MSLNHIDRLFKSAFRTEQYSYKSEYWKDMESRLGPSKGGGAFGKFLGAVVVLISGFSVTSDQLTIPVTAVISKPYAELRSIKNSSNQFSFLEQKNTLSATEIPTHEPNASQGNSLKTESHLGVNQVSEKLEVETVSVAAYNSASKNDALHSSLQQSTQNAEKVGAPVASSYTPTENTQSTSFSKINSAQIASINFKTSQEELDGPLANGTEFGAKIKQSGLTQYFIQGGAYYLQLDPDIVDQNNIPEDFEKEFKSFSMSGAEVLVGAKRRGFKVATGIGISSISKTFSYKFSEENIITTENISSTTYLDNVDSSFSHYEVNEFDNGSSSNFDIAGAVYNVDSNFVTVSDTTLTSSKEVTNNNIAIAYQLDYIVIPLQVGYEIEIERFFIDINAALQLGILSSYNGFKYNDRAEGSKTIITSKDLNPVTLSYTVALGAGYNITPTISVIAQPVYSSTLVGAFKNIKPNNISGLGGKLALRYQF